MVLFNAVPCRARVTTPTLQLRKSRLDVISVPLYAANRCCGLFPGRLCSFAVSLLVLEVSSLRFWLAALPEKSLFCPPSHKSQKSGAVLGLSLLLTCYIRCVAKPQLLNPTPLMTSFLEQNVLSLPFCGLTDFSWLSGKQ